MNPNLPLIEDERAARLRSAAAVARRCVVLFVCVAATKGARRPSVVDWLEREKLWSAASPDEKMFLTVARPAKRTASAMSWRIEALWLLLWSLSTIKRFEVPGHYFLFRDAEEMLPDLGESTRAFVSSAELRSTSDILDASDLLYCLHWACREAYLTGEPLQIDAGIVSERHHAVNWLTRYGNLPWDDVTTDT